MEQRQQIEELIYRSCLALDDRDFKAFLDLCDEGFRYKVSAYSPEIRKEMVWLDHDKKGMETLFTQLPRHNSDHSPLTRHATVYTVKVDGEQAEVVSALQVFRTTLDGGATELYSVARLIDTVKLGGASPKLAQRLVKMETRQLGFGSHIPFWRPSRGPCASRSTPAIAPFTSKRTKGKNSSTPDCARRRACPTSARRGLAVLARRSWSTARSTTAGPTRRDASTSSPSAASS